MKDLTHRFEVRAQLPEHPRPAHPENGPKRTRLPQPTANAGLRRRTAQDRLNNVKLFTRCQQRDRWQRCVAATPHPRTGQNGRSHDRRDRPPRRHQAVRRRWPPSTICRSTVPAGSIYGFIGPNGSGKTTTLRMIMHILLPDEGEIEVLGSRDTAAARDQVSYLPEERGLYKKMTVRRLLRYYAQAERRARQPEIDAAIDDWMARMELPGVLDRPIETLSKGMSQKVQFISAVISKPVAADPRRAVLGPRSGQRPGAEGRGARDAPARHDGRLQHPRHGDRREDVRPHLHDLPGPQGARRHAARHPGAVRRRHRAGPDRRRRRRCSPGCRRSSRVNDFGQIQEVRLNGDPQAFLHQLVARTAVYHFEITRPSLQDIFVRIAKPHRTGQPEPSPA